MAKSNYINNSFIAGEISPRSYGRTDLEQYNQALEETKNVRVFPQGGFTKREGTWFKKEILQSDGTSLPRQARLIPFTATDGSRWQLVITDEEATKINPPLIIGPPHTPDPLDPDDCAWKAINIDDGTVEAFACQDNWPDAITFFDDYYDLSTGLGIESLNELQYAQSGDTMFIVHGKMRPMCVRYLPNGDTDIYGAKFTFTPFPRVYSLYGGSPAAGPAADPDGIDHLLLNGSAHTEMPFLPIGQTLSEGHFTCQVDKNLVADSPDSGDDHVKLTFVFANGYTDLDQTWMGRLLRFSNASETIMIQIYEVVSDTVANGRFIEGVMTADPTTFTSDEIERGYWDDFHGWPETVAFFESRLVFGGTRYFSDYQWFSQINDVKEFAVRKFEQDPTFADPVVSTDPFVGTLKSTLPNKIRWMVPSKTIHVGTNTNEFIALGPDQSLSIGPTNYSSTPETAWGGALVQALRYSNATMFVQRDKKALREMVFNFNEESFKADDLNILAPHIVGRGAAARVGDDFLEPNGAFVAMASHAVPLNVLWLLDNNGMLLGLTRVREQQVFAWHYHELGGTGTIDDVPRKPQIISISTVQKSEAENALGEHDELWMAVKRAVDNEEHIYIEAMAREWELPTIDADWQVSDEPFVAPVYMDCTVPFESATDPTGVIDGLPHGDGAVVNVVLNGIHIGEFTVDTDEIDISAELTVDQIAGTDPWTALIGFNYQAYAIPVVPEVPAQFGSSQGQIRRIDQMTIHFDRSIGCSFGRKTSDTEENTPVDAKEEISFPEGASVGDAIPLFTGAKTVGFPQSYERRPQVMIESSLPFPMTVTHIVSRMVVYEG